MRVQIVCFSLFLLAHAPSAVHGQELIAGDAIRVRHSQSTEPESQWSEGTVVRLTVDSLSYRSNGSVSMMSIDAAEIERSTSRDHRGRGFRIGGLAGAVIGAVIADIIFEPELVPFVCTSLAGDVCALARQFDQLNSGLVAAAKGVAAGVLIGGTAGWLIGKRTGRWETVEVDQITTRDGALSLSFRIRR